MFILDSEQMRRVDERTASEHGISGQVLMDNAGREIAASLLRRHPDLAARRVLVLCGKGNNGGDGVTAARHLLGQGVRVRVALLAEASALKGEAAWALEAARAAGVGIEEAASDSSWAALRKEMPEHDLILDALLGTGTRGAAAGRAREAIEAVNACGCEVVSVDIPSGLSGGSSGVPGPAVEADVTLALAAPKIAHVFTPSCELAGEIEVLDIGIPLAAVEAEHPGLVFADASVVAPLLAPRAREDHKGRFGHVLILAGSRGKSGAAVLMARACLRSGAGLVTVATPESIQPVVAAGVAEAMTEPLPEDARGAVGERAVPVLEKLLEGVDVAAAGPGLGTGAGAAAAIRALVSAEGKSLLLDADALNVMAAEAGKPRKPASPALLTPHPGEAGRLLGVTAREIQMDRRGSVRRLAELLGCAVILKGYRSLTAAPDRPVHVNPTGNPGMATGGSGDVLAGVAAAWLAQGLAPLEAGVLSAHAHGLAGDLAAREKGEISLIAGDLIEALPRAYEAIRLACPR